MQKPAATIEASIMPLPLMSVMVVSIVSATACGDGRLDGMCCELKTLPMFKSATTAVDAKASGYN